MVLSVSVEKTWQYAFKSKIFTVLYSTQTFVSQRPVFPLNIYAVPKVIYDKVV